MRASFRATSNRVDHQVALLGPLGSLRGAELPGALLATSEALRFERRGGSLGLFFSAMNAWNSAARGPDIASKIACSSSTAELAFPLRAAELDSE